MQKITGKMIDNQVEWLNSFLPKDNQLSIGSGYGKTNIEAKNGSVSIKYGCTKREAYDYLTAMIKGIQMFRG